MHIDQYLDEALNATSLPSDRQLSLFLDKGPTAVSEYRTKRAWPDDETMVKIATLADLPTDQALLDLNIWRSKNSDVVDLYRKIASAVSAACFVFFLLGPLPANATGTAPPIYQPAYTLCDILKRLRRRFARLPLPFPPYIFSTLEVTPMPRMHA